MWCVGGQKLMLSQTCGARYGKSSSLKKHIFDKHVPDQGGMANPSKIPKTHPAYEDLKVIPGSDFPSDAEVIRQMEMEIERTLVAAHHHQNTSLQV